MAMTDKTCVTLCDITLSTLSGHDLPHLAHDLHLLHPHKGQGQMGVSQCSRNLVTLQNTVQTCIIIASSDGVFYWQNVTLTIQHVHMYNMHSVMHKTHCDAPVSYQCNADCSDHCRQLQYGSMHIKKPVELDNEALLLLINYVL